MALLGNVTLLDVAKNMPDSKEKGIIMTYATSYHPLATMPFETVPGGTKKWKVVNDLSYSDSSSAYRNLEAEHIATRTPTQTFNANVKIAGGRVKMDRLLKDLAPGDVPIQREGQIASYARQITIDMFEGAGGSAFYGITNLIDNQPLFGGQVVNGGTASTGALISEDMMDEFRAKINYVPGSTFFYMNGAPYRRLRKLARGNIATTGYNVQYTPEQFGYFAGFYDDVPCIVLQDGKGTDLLSNTTGDGSSTTVYAVTYGAENVIGFQLKPITVIPMNEISVLEAFDIEHPMNFACQSVRCIAKLQYVKNAVA